MNLPNILTLARIPMMFVIVGFMYPDKLSDWFRFPDWFPAASLAFWLFIGGAISDWLDGYLARKKNIVSVFGKLMDALTDKIMVIGIMVALADQDAIPMIYVLITLCREFMVSGMRMMAAAKGVVVAADKGGKTKTVTQLIAIGFLLAKPMVARDWSHVLPSWNFDWLISTVHMIGLAGFILGTFLAVWSGYRYFRRYKDVVLADANL